MSNYYKEDFNTWYTPLEASLDKLTDIWTFLKIRKKEGAEILPNQENIFRAFKECPYNDLKVVILGQDPYHTLIGDKPVANGFCFSSGVEGYTPPSLRNIIAEMDTDIFPMHFDPEILGMSDNDAWGKSQAKQGVLLLNTALTVEEGNPECHAKLWSPFTEEVIKKISEEKEHIVWILWGKHAQGYKHLINPNHSIIEAPHPSPFSARTGFFGSRPFSTCNKYLEEHSQTPIQWLKASN